MTRKIAWITRKQIPRYKPLTEKDIASYHLNYRVKLEDVLSALRGLKEEIIKDKKECVKMLTNFDKHKEGDRAVAWICNKQYADMLGLIDKWFKLKEVE